MFYPSKDLVARGLLTLTLLAMAGYDTITNDVDVRATAGKKIQD